MIVTIRPGTTSQPLPLVYGGEVSIAPASGGTATIEYTEGAIDDITNNVALWRQWPLGSPMRNVSTSDIPLGAKYLRVTATGAAVTVSIGEQSAADTPFAFRSMYRQSYQRLSCVVMGDSITELCGGPGSSTPSRFHNYGYFAWMNAILGGKFTMVNNGGVSGETSRQITDRIPRAVLAYNPGYCFLLMGTNDITPNGFSADTIIRNYKEAIDMIADAGIVCVTLAILPRNTIDTASELRTLATVNRWLSWYATQRNGVHFINTHLQMTNRATGLPLSGYLRDGTHPSPLGAYSMGRAIASSLGPCLPADDWYNDDLADTYNIVQNTTVPAANLGAAGDTTSNNSVTAVSGYSGTLSAGFLASRAGGTAGSTAVFAAQATGSDGNADWQELEITACDAATVSFVITKNGNITSGFTVGDLLQGGVELDLESCVDVRSINARITFNDSGGSAIGALEAMMENNFSSGATISQAFRGVLKSPILPIPANTASMTFLLRIISQSINCVGTFRFRRPMVRNITTQGVL